MPLRIVGSVIAVGIAAALGAMLLPFRADLNPATTSLVLVVPVVVGVLVGGFVAGAAGVLGGFLVDDLFFTRPYGHLQVDSGQDWVALAAYVAIMLVLARLVANLERSRYDAQRRAHDARRLLELSELVVENRSVDDLLQAIADAVLTVFRVRGVTLLVPDGDRLVVAATAGQAPTASELHRLDPLAGQPVRLGTSPGSADELQTVALLAGDRPVGLLALSGPPPSEDDRQLLRAFANHAALALERAQLRELALRSQVLEEIDGFRHALMGSVSHDLRTPLATMKVASSTLRDPDADLDGAALRELYALIDEETDRLTRLVSGLLDLNRVDAGVLELHHEAVPVADLVTGVLDDLRTSLSGREVVVDVPADLPPVDVDRVLLGQALANLVDNAHRHAPLSTPLRVSASSDPEGVTISVTDAGPGVPPAERLAVFDRFVRFDTGGRAGLGLWIAKTFVDAHEGRVWVADTPGGGACFNVTLPPVRQNSTVVAPG
ncbi:MAG: DUF4118 domain-containing protein [Acidimicrobiales bacterium]|nr:DUF4118 domain-containing protein [Acidimicrobiales bacterium]